MYRKSGLALATLLVLSTAFLSAWVQVPVSQSSFNEGLTDEESQVIALVNGTSAYDYDLELERIALDHSVSNYAFRSGGSAGATVTAMWLKDQFESFGLETHLESFEFTNWNMPSKPILTIDEDGLVDTDDQTLLNSFQSGHYSLPTLTDGAFGDLVVLPLPDADSYGEISGLSIDTALWDSINTSGKVVLIGREVRWNPAWEQVYQAKLSAQRPAAVVYTWQYSWMSFFPPFFGSVGGRPTGSWGPYYWDLQIPVGWVNYEDGLLIREREISGNVSARVVIPSVIGSGPHYNVVGKLQGKAGRDEFVIISGHYDTVMTSGFVDNGAGTAGVLELARVFTSAAREGLYNSNYTIVFVGFASEEMGLVGSINYVRQHKAEMKNIVAVINLDCIGSDDLKVAQTSPGEDGLDLDELISNAASDLHISATLTGPEGSDQEVFRNPLDGENIYSYWWPGLTAGISDAAAVTSSTMIISYPLFYSDEWNMGEAGWIHTAYDNSTSTQTLNWLESDNLEEHIKVAALSVMRISPSSQGVVDLYSFPWWAVGVVATAGVVAVIVAVVYFVKVRKPPVNKSTIVQ